MKIELSNVSFAYKRRMGLSFALNTLSLTAETGDYVGIVGHNGSGKSTLMRLIFGACLPESGSVIWRDSEQIVKSPKIGLLTQDPRMCLCPSFTVYENFLAVRGGRGHPLRDKIRAALLAVDLSLNSVLDKKVSSLSGGNIQKIAVALVVSTFQDCLCLDEPTASLDIKSSRKFYDFLECEKKSLNGPVFLSSHKIEEVFAFANRIILLKHGEVLIDRRSPFDHNFREYVHSRLSQNSD